MKYIDIDINNIKVTDVDKIVGYFQLGKILAIPTDTIYGLSCVIDNRKIVRRVYRIKKREYNKPVLILVSSIKMAKEYAYISKKQ